MAAGPTEGTQKIELPGVGPIEVTQDAMAHARLENAGALGAATGRSIDLSPDLGSPSDPQAIGVFAHELTHIYQQQARGGRPMPDPASAQGRRLEQQAESARHAAERSTRLSAPMSGARTPGTVSPSSPSGSLAPRILAVAQIAAGAAAGPPGQGGGRAGYNGGAGGGQAGSGGGQRGRQPVIPQVISRSAPQPSQQATQRIVSPFVGGMAGAGAGAGPGGTSSSTQHLDTGKAATTADSNAPKDKGPETPGGTGRVSEAEANRLYREFLHRLKNQLRWETDRSGRSNNFFKD